MKVLRLQLEKNISIVEYDSIEECRMEQLACLAFEEIDRKFICKASELTEKKCLGLVRDIWNEDGSKYYNDYSYNFYAWVDTALLSFMSAVKQNGYYWDENPIEYPDKNNPKYYDEPFNGKGFYNEIYSHDLVEWKKIQEKTFNLDKTLIFEITL